MPLTELEELGLLEQLEAPGLTEVDELAVLEQLEAGEVTQGATAQPAPAAEPAEGFDTQAANLRNLGRQLREGGQRQPEAGAEPVIDPITGQPRQIAGVGEGFKRAFQKFGEPALTVGSAGVSEIGAGLAGIVDPINPFTEKQITPEAGAARTVEMVREAGTFIPRSEVGKQSLFDLAEAGPVKAFIEALQFSESLLGEFGFQKLGPAGGALFATIPTAVLEALGLDSLRRLRLGRSTLMKPDGTPTPELQKALDDAGVDFDSLDDAAKKDLAGPDTSKIPEIAARRARFKEQGFPFTKGDETQDFQIQSQEQRFLSMTLSEESGDLRVLKAKQSAKFIKNVDELVDSLDAPVESGEILKGALEGRLKLLKKEKTALYEQFAKSSPEALEIPIISDSILEAVPDKATVRRISRLKKTEADSFEDLMVEFGINKDTALVDAFTKGGGEITPLNIGNIDDFRQGINLIERNDQSGTIKVITGPVKRALDKEADLVDQAARAAGITDEGILAPLKKARETVRQLKTEFSPNAIAGRLVKTKPDGVTPIIEASKAVDQVIGAGKPIEFLERTLESLGKAGPEGKKAIKGLQASVILKALEASLDAPSRKVDGVRQISGNVFGKALDKIGDDRLALLFKDNPKALQTLKNLQKSGFDFSPAGGAIVKGTGANFLDFVSKFPVFTEMTRGVRRLIEKGADERAVKRSLASDPTAKKTIGFLQRDFPEVADALGVGKRGVVGVVTIGGAAQVGKQVQEGEAFFDQGTTEQREIRRGISREDEQALAEKFGF